MLEDLRTFVAVAEAASFSKVAKSLDVAVSSVSRKIEALESSLGIALFYRTSRVVMLTDAGEQFLPRARNMLAELDEARHSISEMSEDPRGLLTVTAPAAFGRRHLAPAVISFLKLYPLMEIDLHLSDHVVDLSAQRVDVAIRLGALPDSDLVATRLAPIMRLACASPAYLNKFGTPASPSDLLQHNCLTMATSPPAGWWCFAGVNRNAPLAVRGTFRTDDTEAMLQAAVAGIGIVHLASWLVSDMIAAGQLVPLFGGAEVTASNKSPFAVHAVRMPGRSHTAKAQLLIGHLKNEFGAPAYWDRALISIASARPGKTSK